jgi:hypothetical protein
MTNTLHRQGAVENLQGDYVIFAGTAKAVNRKDAGPKVQEFVRICLKHGPASIGSSKHGNVLQEKFDATKFIANIQDGDRVNVVFTDLAALQAVVEELTGADLGLCINISGLLEGAQACCHKAGIERHSVESSLGFWGATDRLPEREILEFNTLCGHGMVSFNFIRKMIEQVKLRRLTPKAAARMLGKCCECGVFNPVRAEKMLERILEKGGTFGQPGLFTKAP